MFYTGNKIKFCPRIIYNSPRLKENARVKMTGLDRDRKYVSK